MDSIPNEVVPYHISNGVVKPSTGDCRRRRNFSELHMTLSEALEKLQAKGLLSHWILSQYHILCLEDAYCRYHQGKGHTTDGCHSLRHAIQDLIDQQVITLPSSTSNLDFVWILFYKLFFLDRFSDFIV